MAKKITVYSTPTCPYCRMTKDFFEKHQIEYSDIDVASDAKAAEEMIKKSGQMGVPVVEINGEIVIGFDEESFRRLLDIK